MAGTESPTGEPLPYPDILRRMPAEVVFGVFAQPL